MRINVQYATLIVKSLEESVEFYRDVLGFTPGYHVDLPQGGQITIMESSDGACIELIEHPEFPVGMYSVSTDVDDLDEVIAHLQAKGYRTTGPAIATSVGRQTFVLDPDGIRICLIQHTQAYRESYMKR